MLSVTAMERRQLQSGFTLLEALLYIVLFSIVIGGAVVSSYQLIDSGRAIKGKIVVESEGNFLLRKLDWALNGFSEVMLPGAGSEGDVLRVRSGSGSILEFTLDGDGDLALDGEKLNSEWVDVSDLVFKHVPPSGTTPRAVETSFLLNGQSFGTTTHYVRY